ncbi:MAG: glycosyl hydrolase, partial [Terrimicrobiaceae bacterium]
MNTNQIDSTYYSRTKAASSCHPGFSVRVWSTILIAAFFAVSLAHAVERPDASNLESSFQSPPSSAHPGVWWHWINGNVSREGITADLEAMQRVGISEAQIFTITGSLPGPMRSLDQFFDMVEFAAKECERLGLKLTVANCPGWSSSGGSWVKPEQSMKAVTFSELPVEGDSSL